MKARIKVAVYKMRTLVWMTINHGNIALNGRNRKMASVTGLITWIMQVKMRKPILDSMD